MESPAYAANYEVAGEEAKEQPMYISGDDDNQELEERVVIVPSGYENKHIEDVINDIGDDEMRRETIIYKTEYEMNNI